jgi:hypothetical protein
MGNISKEVANTLWPAKKYTKKRQKAGYQCGCAILEKNDDYVPVGRSSIEILVEKAPGLDIESGREWNFGEPNLSNSWRHI